MCWKSKCAFSSFLRSFRLLMLWREKMHFDVLSGFFCRHFSHWSRLLHTMYYDWFDDVFFSLSFFFCVFFLFNSLFSLISYFSALEISGWAHNLWCLPLTTTNKSKRCDCCYEKIHTHNHNHKRNENRHWTGEQIINFYFLLMIGTKNQTAVSS